MEIQKTLLVEDHPDAANWLAACILEVFPDTVLAIAPDLQSARCELAAHHFDLALIDIGLPDGSGLDVISAITAQKANTYVIVTTIYDDDATLFEALRKGARGYILKDRDRDRIISYLRGITAGEVPLSAPMAEMMVRHFNAQGGRDPAIPLAPREEQVLAAIAMGQSVAETARSLGVSANTAKSYVKSIYTKLGISSRAEATAHAIRRRLIDLD